MTLKILNLYAGIGGNRKLWTGDIEVTAVENVLEIAKIYQDFFPQDKVIIADAHQYLLDHYKEFDFIWSSPPCPSHSITNNYLHHQGVIRYPDMRLYAEIIFLMKWCKTKFCVENVKSYYKPLILPKTIDRHYFWANFEIGDFFVQKRKFNLTNARASTRRKNLDCKKDLEQFHDIHIPHNTYKEILLLRKCVYPPLALHIFKCAFKEKQEVLKL